MDYALNFGEVELHEFVSKKSFEIWIEYEKIFPSVERKFML